MKQERLNLYTINMKYIRNLHNQGDDHVLSVSPQIHKEHRPFIGIVVICNNKKYCIPLSSPKDKHRTMKNGIDFHKILKDNGELVGVLNLNNMIPVRDDVIQKVDIGIHPSDNPAVRRYKKLVANQLSYCRKNQDVIVSKANRLYRMVQSHNANASLKKRCLNWEKLEKVLDRFPTYHQ